MTDALELLRGLRPAINGLLERYDAVTRHELAAGSYGDAEGRRRATAEREAVGEEYAALSRDLGNLFLLLLWHACEWNPDALRGHFAWLLRETFVEELTPLIAAIERLEGRR